MMISGKLYFVALLLVAIVVIGQVRCVPESDLYGNIQRIDPKHDEVDKSEQYNGYGELPSRYAPVPVFHRIAKPDSTLFYRYGRGDNYPANYYSG